MLARYAAVALLPWIVACQSGAPAHVTGSTSGGEASAQAPSSIGPDATAPPARPAEAQPKPAPEAPKAPEEKIVKAPDASVLAHDFDAKRKQLEQSLERGDQQHPRACPTTPLKWTEVGLGSAFDDFKMAEVALRKLDAPVDISCGEGNLDRCVVRESARYLNYLIRCGLDRELNRSEASRLLTSLLTPREKLSGLVDAVSKLEASGEDPDRLIAALSFAAHVVQGVPDLDKRMKDLEGTEPDLAPHVRALVESSQSVNGDWFRVIEKMDRYMRRRALQFLGAAGREHRPGDFDETHLRLLVFAPGWPTNVDEQPSISSFIGTIEELLTTVILDGIDVVSVTAANEKEFVTLVEREARSCHEATSSKAWCDVVFGVFIASPAAKIAGDRVAAHAYLRFASAANASANGPDVDATVSAMPGPRGDELRSAAAFGFAEAVAERIGSWGKMPLSDKRSVQGLLPSLHAGVSFSDRIEPKFKTREQMQAVLEERTVAVTVTQRDLALDVPRPDLAELLCNRMAAAGLIGRACVKGPEPLSLKVQCFAKQSLPYCDALLLDGETLIYTAHVAGVNTANRPSPSVEMLVADLGSVVGHLLQEFERDPIRIPPTVTIRVSQQPPSWSALLFAGTPWLLDDRRQAGDVAYTATELVLLAAGVASIIFGVEERKTSSDRANALMVFGNVALIGIAPLRLISAAAYDSRPVSERVSNRDPLMPSPR